MARPKKGEELEDSTYVGFRIPQALREAVERLAAGRGTFPAEEYRKAVEAYVKAAERKGRK